MVTFHNETNPVNMLPGLTRRTLATSQAMMICEFTFEPRVTIPLHSHPHEQVGYVVRGRVEMTIAGHTETLGPGDSYCAPSNIPHSAFTLEPTIIVDTFSPPREDYSG
jgi:quercetin dioxygenase-like cupin family protein